MRPVRYGVRMPQEHTLRDRKRRRTRQAIIDAAVDLFERHGYDETTVADIAAAAEIGTRTFFNYFASKEELLFPEAEERLRAALAAIDARLPGDRPTELLLRALGEVGAPDLVGPIAGLRLRLVATVPAVRGRGLQLQLDAQRAIATRLHEAFPDELDEVEAGALVGAFVGAITGGLQTLLADPAAREMDPELLRDRLRQATETVLTPWIARP
jgi:AcrR family transcriptional regulator